MKRALAASLGGLALIAAGCASAHPAAAPHTSTPAAAAPTTSAPPPPPPAPTPSSQLTFPMGTPVPISQGGTAAATITVDQPSVFTTPVQSYGSRPANGYFVVVHIAATTDSGFTQGFDINSLDFYALSHGQQYQEGNGNSYDALTDSQSSSDITATLGAGQSSSGWEAFDVAYPHGTIVYAPNSDAQPVSWSGVTDPDGL